MSNVKVWDEVPLGHQKVMTANFMKKQEPGILAWIEAKEPSYSDSEEENPNEVSCDNFEKKMVQSSILKHISQNEKCSKV